MTKANSIDARNASSSREIPPSRKLSAGSLERTVTPLSLKSKCAIAALTVGVIAGLALIGMGSASLFGPLDSMGFIASVVGGGVLTIACGGGIVWIVFSNRKEEKPVQPSQATATVSAPLPRAVPNTATKVPPKGVLHASSMNRPTPNAADVVAATFGSSQVPSAAGLGLPPNDPASFQRAPVPETAAAIVSSHASAPMPSAAPASVSPTPAAQAAPDLSVLNAASPPPPPASASAPILTREIGQIIGYLQQDPYKNMAAAVSSVRSTFFDNKSQERAKALFTEVMERVFGAEVSFPRPVAVNVDKTGVLDPTVFHSTNIYATLGGHGNVEGMLTSSRKDSKRCHVYQVASQYNATQGGDIFGNAPHIGSAMGMTNKDQDQGALFQRTNSDVFELVNAFLAHLGFNMLHEVVPSAGKTTDEQGSISNGILKVTKQNGAQLANEFVANYAKSEYVCYPSFPSGGNHPIYLLLQASPTFFFCKEKEQEEIQKYAALANYTALFQHGITLAEKTGKPVVLHVERMGGSKYEKASNIQSGFAEEVARIQWGFEKAALAFQEQMKKVGVVVQIEAHDGPLHTIARNLKLAHKGRIGDQGD